MPVDVHTQMQIGVPRDEYEWEDAAGGSTLMKLRNRGNPSGFAKWAAPMMATSMRRANRKDLARLKRVLEAAAC